MSFKNNLSTQVPKYPSASFTLIELMVSIGIIVTVIISAVGIYIYSIGPQQKTIATTNLQQDGQLILNLIAKDVRMYRWDYGGVCVSNPIHKINLTDNNSPATLVKYQRCKWVGSPPSIADCSVNETDCFLAKCKGPTCPDSCNSSYKQLNMADTYITRFDVYLNPSCDPFASNATEYQIPQVTIVLELKSYKERFGERRIKLQQTVRQVYQEKSQY